jgi:hypothetical protein
MLEEPLLIKDARPQSASDNVLGITAGRSIMIRAPALNLLSSIGGRTVAAYWHGNGCTPDLTPGRAGPEERHSLT